ncbi:LysM domain-containing protein [Heracleum sosnowskyi]|uniref:LysM domain-containing protein n=1 Tax=Heracleum sosnowskyi TaxID=360622 RepID=A0AAD8MQT4_9APIA|nr:LysM domain-containing protein [Heracleum sosnowskyi]
MEQQLRNSGGNGFDDYGSFDSPMSSSSPSNKLYSVSSAPLPISSCSYSYSYSGAVGGNYIEHTVTKFDTLAGVAIKYGVEVADVKKLNGLVSDLQMFALKTLYIPLPGRHPPTPIVTNESEAQSSEQTPPRRRHSDLFDSLQSLKIQSPDQGISPAMHSLRGYYSLTPLDEKTDSKGCEMAVYQKAGSHYLEDGPFVPESDKWSGSLARRRLKSEADFNNYHAPEKLLKEDGSSNGFSIVAGKGLALRAKAAINRALSGVNGETLGQNSVSTAVGDISLVKNSGGVKRSFSTPNFQDSENSSSMWPAVNWGLKPDFQALSAATTIIPTGRRNKTAVD